jgi:hypothetical protein
VNRLLAVYPSLLVASGSTAATFAAPQWLFAPLAALAVLALLDAKARWYDYLWLVNALRRFDHARSLRLIGPFRHSWCQRTVAYCALREFGRGRDALSYFHALGYRWWHLLPDGTFSLGCPYLHPSFYKALFFGTKRQRRKCHDESLLSSVAFAVIQHLAKLPR